MKVLLAGCCALYIMSAPTAMAAESVTSVDLSWSWTSAQSSIGASWTTNEERIAASKGAELYANVSCYGPECEPERPAMLQIQKAGEWTTYAEGTLSGLDGSIVAPPPVDTSALGTYSIRAVLPATASAPQITTPPRGVVVLPATKVTLRGSIEAPSRTNGSTWVMAPGPVTLKIAVSPAAPGRTVLIRDTSKSPNTIIGRVKTNARGIATWQGTVSNAMHDIVVQPGRGRAGWFIVTVPANPVG